MKHKEMQIDETVKSM